MTILTTQENLDIKITSDLDEDVLIVDELTVDESLHQLFDIRIITHSTNIDIDINAILGTNMTVSFDIHGTKRYFSGIVCRFEQVHTIQIDKKSEHVAFYQIRLVPKTWLLTHTKDYRIFQNKTVQEIIKTILTDASISDFVYKTKKGTTKKREYCVQYNESNLDFIARLCEEEGIFFHFEHEESIHKLYFSDSSIIATKIGGEGYPFAKRSPESAMANTIYECMQGEQITTGDVTVMDFNYLNPSVSLSSDATSDNLGGSYYDYPALFQETSDGEPIAKNKLNAFGWNGKFIQGASTIPELTPYKTFSVLNHPRKSLNGQYITSRIKHKISQKKSENDLSYTYENEFWAFPAKIPFVPVLKHEKKRIHSLQTATVTGPKGEEIYTDKYARIKVKFHWDSRGTEDEKSSCWVRVAQSWAGGQWGGLVIPRVGMEVVVSFLDGDPDRPLVMGCVYNADNMPPYDSTDPTKSTFKSSTTKGNDGNNELRFDDKKDSEEIYIHAQKDMNVDIENSRTETIIKGDDTLTIQKGSKTETLEGKDTTYKVEIKNGDRELQIDKGNQKITLDKGNREITLKSGDQTVTLKKGDQTVTLSMGDYSTTLKKGDMSITLKGGDLKIDVKGDIKLSSTGAMTFDSKGKMTLKAVKGIEMSSPDDITIKSVKNLSLQANMDIKAKGAMNTNIEAGMNLIAKGGMNSTIEGGIALNLKGTLINSQASGPNAIKGAIIKLN
jgi:type VI secretion system secreted protein VgrG